MRKSKKEKKCRSNIGGQAVIEGIMMRGERSMATAVRDENKNIVVESSRFVPLREKNVIYRIPFIRGIFNFLSTMVMGVKILTRSAEVFGGEEEPSKADKWLAKKLKINVMSIVTFFAVAIGILLSVGLFFILPNLITGGITKLFSSTIPSIVVNLMEGAIRLTLFVLYLLLISLMKDIKRTFMYHGAEHKTISCYEKNLELTVDNARKMSRIHDRCGTTFMFIVMVISILFFSLTGWNGQKIWERILIRLVLLPVVAGVSYEILKFLAKFDNWFVKILKAPGLLLQKITTKEPTDDMLEVAIVAFKAVAEMDADESVPIKKFDINLVYNKSRNKIEKLLEGKVEKSDIDWLYVAIVGCKRSELENMTYIKQSQSDKVDEMAEKIKQGDSLQIALGFTEFCGNKFIVNKDVLCPRYETEELVEKAICIINSLNLNRVLDLCTGSGVIGISLAVQTRAEIICSDISELAIKTAINNAELNNAKVEFLASDMFENINGKFDIIISNPPYISTLDINNLEDNVKNNDPKIALDGGEDGLKFYRIIADNAKNFLNDNGYVLAEFGIEQAENIRLIFSNFDVAIAKDINGIERILIAKVK